MTNDNEFRTEILTAATAEPKILLPELKIYRPQHLYSARDYARYLMLAEMQRENKLNSKRLP